MVFRISRLHAMTKMGAPKSTGEDTKKEKLWTKNTREQVKYLKMVKVIKKCNLKRPQQYNKYKS